MLRRLRTRRRPPPPTATRAASPARSAADLDGDGKPRRPRPRLPRRHREAFSAKSPAGARVPVNTMPRAIRRSLRISGALDPGDYVVVPRRHRATASKINAPTVDGAGRSTVAAGMTESRPGLFLSTQPRHRGTSSPRCSQLGWAGVRARWRRPSTPTTDSALAIQRGASMSGGWGSPPMARRRSSSASTAGFFRAETPRSAGDVSVTGGHRHRRASSRKMRSLEPGGSWQNVGAGVQHAHIRRCRRLSALAYVSIFPHRRRQDRRLHRPR